MTKTYNYIQEAIKEMKSVDWDMVKLGGHNWNLKFEKVKGCQVLEIDNQNQPKFKLKEQIQKGFLRIHNDEYTNLQNIIFVMKNNYQILYIFYIIIFFP